MGYLQKRDSRKNLRSRVEAFLFDAYGVS